MQLAHLWRVCLLAGFVIATAPLSAAKAEAEHGHGDDHGHAEADHHDEHEHAADGCADSHVSCAGALQIIHTWANATNGKTARVYAEIVNTGDSVDALIGGEAPFGDVVTIRGAALEGGEMVTRPLDALPLPAGAEVELSPNVVFVEVAGLSEPLHQGEEFEIELFFQNAGHVTVTGEVEAAGATQHSHAGHSH